jgi:trans-aconitate 2-methyltransferase
VSDPQFGWALEQLERLPLAGDEVVLDAGCGTGRVTAVLSERVPRGRVYGVDVSESMVAHARAALKGGATILRQDLVELELPEPVDAAFSNATFHWIGDHDKLFAALAAAMKPGARLVAQCGGRGNIESFRQAAEEAATEALFAPYFGGWQRPWNYAGAGETAVRLERAGFDDVRTWLEPRRVRPERAFIKTVCLLRHIEPLPEQLRDRFVDAVIGLVGEPVVLDYVRLNITACRGNRRS